MDSRRDRADAELVGALIAGSGDALAALYDRHVEAVFAASMRLTGDRGLAEEVVQETFLTLWNQAELFDPAAGPLAAWLRSIARNRTIDRLRAAGRRPPAVALSAFDRAGVEPGSGAELLARAGGLLAASAASRGPEEIVESAEVRAAIREAMAELPEAERAAIALAYGEDLSQAKIAERLGWPLGTVKTRTRRALARLRAALPDDLAPRRTGRATAPPAAEIDRADGPAEARADARPERGRPALRALPTAGPPTDRHGPR